MAEATFKRLPQCGKRLSERPPSTHLVLDFKRFLDLTDFNLSTTTEQMSESANEPDCKN